MTSYLALANLALPVDPVPVQCADDARPDPVAHAVRPRAPRHHTPLSGPTVFRVRRSRGQQRTAASWPPWAWPSRCCSSRLCSSQTCSSRLWARPPRAVRYISALPQPAVLPRFSIPPLPLPERSPSWSRRPERKAPIARLRGGGSQNKSCNQNEFTHVEISP